MEKDIYNMKLHDTFKLDTGLIDFYILRVPGGWIYSECVEDAPLTFVPFDNEFQKNNGENVPAWERTLRNYKL